MQPGKNRSIADTTETINYFGEYTNLMISLLHEVFIFIGLKTIPILEG